MGGGRRRWRTLFGKSRQSGSETSIYLFSPGCHWQVKKNLDIARSAVGKAPAAYNIRIHPQLESIPTYNCVTTVGPRQGLGSR